MTPCGQGRWDRHRRGPAAHAGRGGGASIRTASGDLRELLEPAAAGPAAPALADGPPTTDAPALAASAGACRPRAHPGRGITPAVSALSLRTGKDQDPREDAGERRRHLRAPRKGDPRLAEILPRRLNSVCCSRPGASPPHAIRTRGTATRRAGVSEHPAPRLQLPMRWPGWRLSASRSSSSSTARPAAAT